MTGMNHEFQKKSHAADGSQPAAPSFIEIKPEISRQLKISLKSAIEALSYPQAENLPVSLNFIKKEDEGYHTTMDEVLPRIKKLWEGCLIYLEKNIIPRKEATELLDSEDTLNAALMLNLSLQIKNIAEKAKEIGGFSTFDEKVMDCIHHAVMALRYHEITDDLFYTLHELISDNEENTIKLSESNACLIDEYLSTALPCLDIEDAGKTTGDGEAEEAGENSPEEEQSEVSYEPIEELAAWEAAIKESGDENSESTPQTDDEERAKNEAKLTRPEIRACLHSLGTSGCIKKEHAQMFTDREEEFKKALLDAAFFNILSFAADGEHVRTSDGEISKELDEARIAAIRIIKCCFFMESGGLNPLYNLTGEGK